MSADSSTSQEIPASWLTASPVRLESSPRRAQEPHVLEPGHTLDLADEYEVVYDVTPERMSR